MHYPELEQTLAALHQTDNFRSLRLIDERQQARASLNGIPMLNLSSNDYLGLATDHSLHQTFFQSLSKDNLINDFGLSSSSSRLLTGNHKQYVLLESQLAASFNREASLVFNSGYHANIGILPALLTKNDAVFSDRLNHASIIDGIQLSDAKLYRYKHLDMNHLESLLSKYRKQHKRVIIISESVFSMDGDCADLKSLIQLKQQFDSWLYIDEAHAIGVFGPNGLGLCDEQKVIEHIDFIVGTFGKAIASLGAYIICDQLVRDYLINKMRPFIFTTALPPVSLSWTRFILSALPSMVEKRKHVLHCADQLRQALNQSGLTALGKSPIIPIILGENETTLTVAEQLQEKGLMVFPIRPPTVPPGTARLRLSLTAAMTWKDLEKLPDIIKKAI